MKEILTAVFQVSVLIFVVGSMLAMGFSLTIQQILDPLKKMRLVIFSLLANFVVVPVIVLLLIWLIPVTEGERIALILLSLAAGAPFLPKLADIAESNAAFSIGLMLLLMTVTIFYLPLVLPFLLPGTAVNSWSIARSLIVLMLIPLILALIVRAKYPQTARKILPVLTRLTNLALIVLTLALVVLHTKSLIAMIGPGILAILLFLALALAVGYGMGGPDKDNRIVLSLGTGQRNISAALVVATQNFADDPQVVITMVALAIIGLILMLPYARRFSKQSS